jgi:HAMP domain-containing protein
MTPEEIAVILTRLEERIGRIERLLQEIAQGMGIET